jgi:hypothetical protein
MSETGEAWDEEKVARKTHEVLEALWKPWRDGTNSEAGMKRRRVDKGTGTAEVMRLQAEYDKLLEKHLRFRKVAADRAAAAAKHGPLWSHDPDEEWEELEDCAMWCDRFMALLHAQIKVQKCFKDAVCPPFFKKAVEEVHRATKRDVPTCVYGYTTYGLNDLPDHWWSQFFSYAVDWLKQKCEDCGGGTIHLTDRPFGHVHGAQRALALHGRVVEKMMEDASWSPDLQALAHKLDLLVGTDGEGICEVLHPAMEEFLLDIDFKFGSMHAKSKEARKGGAQLYTTMISSFVNNEKSLPVMIQALEKALKQEGITFNEGDIGGLYMHRLARVFVGSTGAVLHQRQFGDRSFVAARPRGLRKWTMSKCVYVLGWCLHKEHRRTLKVIKMLRDDGHDPAGQGFYSLRLRSTELQRDAIEKVSTMRAMDEELSGKMLTHYRYTLDRTLDHKEYTLGEHLTFHLRGRGLRFPSEELCKAWFHVEITCIQHLLHTPAHRRSFMFARGDIHELGVINSSYYKALAAARVPHISEDGDFTRSWALQAYADLFERLVDRYLHVWQGEFHRQFCRGRLRGSEPLSAELKTGS